MKFLVLLAVVLVVLWWLRGSRRADTPNRGAPPRPGTTAQQQDMVQCPVCSVHLPRSDALPGPNGQLYCCAEHRQRAEA
jgi:uncharacterized protein